MTCRRARPQWPLEIMPDRPANCLPGNASAVRKDQFLRPLFDLFLTAFFHHGHVLVKSNHTMLKNKPYYQPYNLYQAQANPSCRRLSFLAPRVLRKPLVSCPGFYNTTRFPCKRFHGGMSNRSAIWGSATRMKRPRSVFTTHSISASRRKRRRTWRDPLWVGGRRRRRRSVPVRHP